MKSVRVILFIVFCFLMAGCDNYSSISGQRVDLSELGTGSENIKKIVEVIDQYEYGKYVKLSVHLGADQSNTGFIFNTEQGIFDHDYEAHLPMNRYQVSTDKTGAITVIDKFNGVTILQRNLITQNSFETVEDLSIKWSNTGKYLFISHVRNRDYFLHDFHANREIQIPFEGYIGLNWSEDDEMALLSNNPSPPLKDLENIYLYGWSLKNGTIFDLGKEHAFYRWSPDNYLFAVSITNDPKVQYVISRYSFQDRQWEEVYITDKTIISNSFKIINKDEFVFAGKATTKTINPFRMLMKPKQDFVVDVDVAKNTAIIRKLDAYLPKVFIWSYDNEYLYYQDQNGFYKAEVSFNSK